MKKDLQGYPCSICGEYAGVNKHHNVMVCNSCDVKLYNKSYRRCKRCQKESWQSCEPAQMKIFRETQEKLGFSYQKFGNIIFLTSGCASCLKEEIPVAEIPKERQGSPS